MCILQSASRSKLHLVLKGMSTSGFPYTEFFFPGNMTGLQIDGGFVSLCLVVFGFFLMYHEGGKVTMGNLL